MHHTELASRRRSLRLTQRELAERLSVHPNTVARWERGELTIERPQMIKAMLDVIEGDLAAESPEQQQAREEHWRRYLRDESRRREESLSPEQREAAEDWFRNKR